MLPVAALGSVTAASAADPRLGSAAHEFEACLMKELHCLWPPACRRGRWAREIPEQELLH